jgi:hypothetical protein
MNINQKDVGKMIYEIGRIDVGATRHKPSRSFVIPILVECPDHWGPTVDPISGRDLVVQCSVSSSHMPEGVYLCAIRQADDDRRDKTLTPRISQQNNQLGGIEEGSGGMDNGQEHTVEVGSEEHAGAV